MASNTVPSEILRQIFSYLGYTDLLNVSLTSSKWYPFSQELLYNAPSFFPTSIVLFLRTVLTPGNNSLADHVRTLSITWQNHYAQPVDPADLHLFTAGVERSSLNRPLSLTDDHVALLLHLLPRVLVLDLCPPDSPSNYNQFLGLTSGNLPLALQSVRQISCTWISHQRGVTSEMLLAIILLPSIRTIEVQILDEIEDPYPAIHNKTSTVTRLDISYSQISLLSLGYILQLPRALTHLSFTSTITTDHTVLEELQTALDPVKNTLQMLEVDIEGWHFGEDGPGSGRPVRSFRTWPVLCRLKCPLRLLLGDRYADPRLHLEDVLPHGIHHLEIGVDHQWTGEDVVEEFVRLVAQKAVVAPGLRNAVWNDWGVLPELTKRLSDACEVADVILAQAGLY